MNLKLIDMTYINGNNGHKVDIQEEWWEIEYTDVSGQCTAQTYVEEKDFNIASNLLSSRITAKRHVVKALNRLYSRPIK